MRIAVPRTERLVAISDDGAIPLDPLGFSGRMARHETSLLPSLGATRSERRGAARVKVAAWTALWLAAPLVACGGAPPAHAESSEEDAGVEEAAPEAPEVALDAPELSRPASTATYESAMSTPENLDVHDDRAHLTDGQLMGPMRGVMSRCGRVVPSNARVTVKTAVQNGRAIGVTVLVRFERSGSAKRPPSRAALRKESKLSAKIVSCVDRAVRGAVWPPSSRRDSFTTEF